jgi:hypothetical protein
MFFALQREWQHTSAAISSTNISHTSFPTEIADCARSDWTENALHVCCSSYVGKYQNLSSVNLKKKSPFFSQQ